MPRIEALEVAAKKVVSRTPFMERWPVLIVYSDGRVQVCSEFLSGYYSIERHQCERIDASGTPLAAFVFVDSRILNKYRLSTGLRTRDALARLMASTVDEYSQWIIIEEVEYEYDVIPGDMVTLVYQDSRRSIIEINYRKADTVKAKALRMCAEQHKDEFRRSASSVGVDVIDVRLCSFNDSMCVMPCVVIPLDIDSILAVLNHGKPPVHTTQRAKPAKPVTLTLPELTLEEARPERQRNDTSMLLVYDDVSIE